MIPPENNRLVLALTVPISLVLLGDRLEKLAQHGFEIHVVVGAIPEWDELPEAIRLHVVPMKRAISPLADTMALIRLYRLLRQLRPFIAVGATPKASLLLLTAARLARVPHRIWEAWGAAWDTRHSFLRTLLKNVDRQVSRNSTDILAVSQSLADLLVASRVCMKQPLVLGHGSTKGISIARYSPVFRAELPEPPVLGFIGRLSSDKGVSDIVAVAKAVRRIHTSTRLLLVGDFDEADPVDVDTRAEVVNSSWITVTGWVDDTSIYWPQIDLLVFPRAREGLPNAVLEAAASGVPTVGYDVTGTRDAVISGVTGILVPARNSLALSEAALTLLNDRILYRSAAIASRAMAVKSFESRLVISNYTTFYTNFLNSARGTPQPGL